MLRLLLLVAMINLGACAGMGPTHTADWDSMKYSDFAALGGSPLSVGR